MFGPISGVFANEITGLGGANGAGKSMSLAMIRGELMPCACSLAVGGKVGFLDRRDGDRGGGATRTRCSRR